MRHPSRTARDGHHEALLNQFFAEQAGRRSPAVQRRYERIHRHLLSFLAIADLGAELAPHEQAAVVAERRRGGSFFDVLGFEELIACLPLFIASDWKLDPLKDARAQVSLTGTLIRWLIDGSHVHPDGTTTRRAHLTLLPGGQIDP